ncbi:hypothetical protein [Streptomyces sp. NPDC015350]|uniref:hypothetical protein n=1 Tax=Streptomyces sp. NPDC015350 TaxID=3364955 RepID=UPI00370306C4
MDSARTPSNSFGSPPWRRTSRSSMESAPAIMPPTMLIAFAPVKRSFSATRADRPHRSASRNTGTSPACAIRFGSSNAAKARAGPWEDFT